MTAREKTLAVLVGALVLLVGFRALHNNLDSRAKERRTTLRGLKDTLRENDATFDRGKAAMKKLTLWQSQSLPYDPQDDGLGVAASDYYHWLYEQLSVAPLRDVDVTRGGGARSRSVTSYRTLSFIADATGSLESLTKFLCAFYEAPFLHRISQLNVTPEADGKTLEIRLTVEALVLPTADRTQGLPDSPPLPLAQPSDEYQAEIVGRNIFAVYQRPAPPPQQQTVVVKPTNTTPKFDDATQAYITGIVEDNGELQVWLKVRTTGKKMRLRPGDDFKIGLMEGRVAQILPRRIVIESEGKRIQVRLGQNLREGQTVAADGERGEGNQLSAIGN